MKSHWKQIIFSEPCVKTSSLTNQLFISGFAFSISRILLSVWCSAAHPSGLDSWVLQRFPFFLCHDIYIDHARRKTNLSYSRLHIRQSLTSNLHLRVRLALRFCWLKACFYTKSWKASQFGNEFLKNWWLENIEKSSTSNCMQGDKFLKTHDFKG